MLDNNLHVSNRTCFVVAYAIPSRSSITRVTRSLFPRSTRSFGWPHFCLSILTPTSSLRCATEDWLMPTKVATLQVERPLLSCTKAWCFCSWDNRGIWLQTILQTIPHILRNQGYIFTHIDLDVGRVTVNKSEYFKPNHFDIYYFRNLIFSLFSFTFMHLITWTLALITLSLSLWFESTDNGSCHWVCVQCTLFCS